ncbi:MAG: flagellar basal body-associated FliL family protein [Candidatus Azotimanducaceae bacterium]
MSKPKRVLQQDLNLDGGDRTEIPHQLLYLCRRLQVNLFGSRKIMQVKLGLSTYYDEDTMFNEEEGTTGWIPRHLVGIRAGILKSLRKVTEETMNTDEGQQELLEELRLVINESLEKYEKTTSAPIEEVYFTELIIQ